MKTTLIHPSLLLLLFPLLFACKDEDIRTAGDSPTAQDYRLLAKVALRQDAPDSALTYLHMMDSLSRHRGDDTSRAKALYNIGHVYRYGKRDYRAALAAYLVALDFAKESDNPRMASISMKDIGIVFMAVDEHAAAIGYFEEAAQVHPPSGAALVRHHLNLGICHKKKPLPDHVRSEAHYRSALAACSSLPSGRKKDYYLQRAHNLLGLLEYDRGDFPAALEDYGRALGYSTSDEKAMIAHYNTAETLTALGRHTAARAALDRAAGILESGTVRDQAAIIEYHNIEGEYFRATGQGEKAESSWMKAVDLADKGVISPALQRTLGLLVGQLERSDLKHASMARVIHAQAGQAQLVQQFKDLYRRESLQQVVRLHESRKEADSALDRFATATAIAIALGLLAYLGIGGFFYLKVRHQRMRRNIIRIIES